MLKNAIMIQGTSSNAGKSLVAAGLCRILKRRGLKVAPFKPQNMSLNSVVTGDGGEIGRAQATQALACEIEPHSDMNPVLLKPLTDVGAQVIIRGRPLRTMTAGQFHDFKPRAMDAVKEAFARLSQEYQAIVIEGAGSPAEINLRQGDIANMGFAEAIDCPVILVGDIDRGGVFAQLVGTLSLLSPSEQARIQGFVINKFRGDQSILQPGIDWLETHTGKKVLGVLPYLENLYMEAEDSLSQDLSIAATEAEQLKVAVIRFPKLSNSTDFDPLSLHPQVDLRYVTDGESLQGFDLIILPGSRSVAADLHWLKKTGLSRAIERHLRYGGKVLGICGGFQMLGQALLDPDAVESREAQTACLGLLEMCTTMAREKTLTKVSGKLTLGGATVTGYEIHMGQSRGEALNRPLVNFVNSHDGAISEDEQIIGTYLHGLFDEAEALKAMLSWAGLKNTIASDYRAVRIKNIDRIADAMEVSLDLAGTLSHLAPEQTHF
ncbi:MAG: cobyric acid synthase [Candidatus Obscuribacter sp.]|nr:cobyric acid synthase [Candidatus Obscuribacter sp.]